MMQRTGCLSISTYPFFGFRIIQRVIYTLIKGLIIVHIINPMRDSHNVPLGIDKSKYLIILLISSFSLFVQLVKPSYSSVIFNPYIYFNGID